MQIDATYSPEDNKIRLYASERLDDETYRRVKEAGFKWAPKQELFVAPKWSPKREDLALELAGEISAEEMTLAERAQAKAERLDILSEKRASESNAYQRRAREISQRFEFGQPILVGHHSERKARKDRDQMDASQQKAIKAHDLACYWQYRAEGVERYANWKNDPKVRARRIKTLLSELRDFQRQINDANKALLLWEKLSTEQMLNTGYVTYGLWSKVENKEMTPDEAREYDIKVKQQTVNSNWLRRQIAHTLNRLSYEREMLGEVPRFTDPLTPVIIQQFLREHGAEKPKASSVDTDLFVVECAVPLPLHIGDGSSLELSADEWRDLMHSCGFVPPTKKPAKPPILNFESPTGFIQLYSQWSRSSETYPVIAFEKAAYGKIPSDQRGTRLSPCGTFRFRICPNPNHRYGWCAAFISDQKKHDAPSSACFDAPERAA